jgi:hypothetical protein
MSIAPKPGVDGQGPLQVRDHIKNCVYGRQLQQHSPGGARALRECEIRQWSLVDAKKESRGQVDVAICKSHQLADLSRGISSGGPLLEDARAGGHRAQTP